MTEIDCHTRDIGGYGLMILEAGGANACGLSLYYGSAAGGHGHHDRLNIEMGAGAAAAAEHPCLHAPGLMLCPRRPSTTAS